MCSNAGLTEFSGNAVFQPMVTTVPAAMLLTAAAAVARFQKKQARMTGVSAAE